VPPLKEAERVAREEAEEAVESYADNALQLGEARGEARQARM
jgi:hypothetical protein